MTGASDIHLVHVLVRMKDTKSVRWGVGGGGGRQTYRVDVQFAGSVMFVLPTVHGYAVIAAPVIPLLLFSCASFNV